MSNELDALQTALGAEHAAIWVYGVIGTHAAQTRQPAVAAVEQIHRTRRDQLESLIVTASAVPSPGAAAYQLPAPITDPTSAITVAGQIEDQVAAVWRFALGDCSSTGARTFALTALIQTSIQSLTWRQAISGADTMLYPFPGQPS